MPLQNAPLGSSQAPIHFGALLFVLNVGGNEGWKGQPILQHSSWMRRDGAQVQEMRKVFFINTAEQTQTLTFPGSSVYWERCTAYTVELRTRVCISSGPAAAIYTKMSNPFSPWLFRCVCQVGCQWMSIFVTVFAVWMPIYWTLRRDHFQHWQCQKLTEQILGWISFGFGYKVVS